MTNAQHGAPAFLAADWRFAGDDWQGDNALTYIVYETAPVYGSDGVTITTPGVARDLSGCTVTGTARYQPAAQSTCGQTQPAAPIMFTGALVDAPNGVISLSLASTSTAALPRQSLSQFSDPTRALLLIQPRVADAGGNKVTVGLQPLFVF